MGGACVRVHTQIHLHLMEAQRGGDTCLRAHSEVGILVWEVFGCLPLWTPCLLLSSRSVSVFLQGKFTFTDSSQGWE